MKIGMIAGAVVVLAGGGYLVKTTTMTGAGTAAAGDMLFAAKRGKLVVTITENGSLMAKNSEKITFQGKRGGGKVTFLIEEGKSVEAGEVLCRLDTKEMEDQVQQLDMDVKKTEVELKSAQTEFEITKGDNVASIEKAQMAVTKAQNELEKYRDGDAPKEQANLEVAIKEAETNHEKSKKKYADSVKLREQDYINQSQLDTDKIEFERAEIKLTASRRDLELFNKYTYPMTMTERETAVKDAQRGLDNAKLRADSTLEQKEVTVKGAQQRLNSLRNKLKETQEEIEKFTIKAPGPGIVLHGDPQQRWWGGERLKLGANVWGGQTLFTIPDLRVMQVQVQIHEADINKLKDQQAASVTMDTYPGLVLKGKVTKIAQVAGSQNPWEGDDVKKFTVEITLDERPELKLKPGISAKAEIFIEERPDVLFVPRQCVFVEEGQHYCYVQRGGGDPDRVIVKPDINNDNFVQINEGLSEGERVLLYNPNLKGGPTASPSSQPAAATPPAVAAAP